MGSQDCLELVPTTIPECRSFVETLCSLDGTYGGLPDAWKSASSDISRKITGKRNQKLKSASSGRESTHVPVPFEFFL